MRTFACSVLCSAARVASAALFALTSSSAQAQFIDRILPNQPIATNPIDQSDGSAVGPPAMSADGQFVVFATAATDMLGPGNDGNGRDDVFVTNLSTGVTELVSLHTDGTQGNFNSGSLINPPRADVGISDDGRLVVFTSFASNLVGTNCMAMPSQVTCDNNGQRDLFLHDRQTGTTVRVGQSERTGVPPGTVPGIDASSLGPESAAISGDGKWVALITGNALVNGDFDEFGPGEVYLKQLGGNLIRASIDTMPDQGVVAFGPLSLSDDGRRVVYSSTSSTLVAGDTNGQADVFLYDRITMQVTRVSVADDEAQGNDASRGGVISGDGRYVAFFSAASNLTPPVADVGGGIYVRDLDLGTTVEIHGTGCVPPPAFGCIQGTGLATRISISDDGGFVAFDYTGNDMSWPGDNTPAADIYLWDRLGAQVHRISVDTLGDDPDFSALAPAVTDDGGLVAFTSLASDLVTGDTNSRADVFIGTPAGAATVVRPIQSVVNSVRRSDGKAGHSLVAAKEIVLRTFVRTRRSLGEMFDAFAEACIDGAVASCPPGKSFQAEGKVYAFGSQFTEQERRNGGESINLVLRNGAESILTPGVHTIEVRVSPDSPGAFPVVTRKVEAIFHTPQSYDLLFYPVAIDDAAMNKVTPSPTILASGADFFRATYPVDEQGVSRATRPAVPFPATIVSNQQRRDLALALAKIFAEDRKALTARNRFGAGVVPEFVDGNRGLDSLNGYTYKDLKGVVVSLDQRDGSPVLPSTLTHEVGHQYGFNDEYCWDATDGEDVLETPCQIDPAAPNPPPQSEVQGSEAGTYIAEGMFAWDVKPITPGRSAVFGPPGSSIIGYMGYGPEPVKWTTDIEYAHLYRNITDPPMGPGTAPRSLAVRTVAYVSGIIHQNGTVVLSPLIVFDTDEELPEPPPGTAYAIDVLDDGDQVIGTVEFDLTFLLELFGEEEAEVVEEDEVPFGFYVELPAGAQTLLLREGVAPLAEVEKSANAPMIAFTSVTPGAGNALDLVWSASDLDLDDLTYTVYYSPNGTELQALATDLEATSFSFDLDGVAPIGLGGFVRVKASDGWNFAEDDFDIGPEFAVLDVDANGAVEPLFDGLIILRHLFGFSGDTLIDGAAGAGCTRCDPADIETYLDGIATQLNADGNPFLQPLTDGVLILRYLSGLTGPALTNGAVGASCTRCDSAAIVPHLDGLD